MAEGGVMRACVAAIMGVALAIAGPYAFVGVEVTWQKMKTTVPKNILQIQ